MIDRIEGNQWVFGQLDREAQDAVKEVSIEGYYGEIQLTLPVRDGLISEVQAVVGKVTKKESRRSA